MVDSKEVRAGNWLVRITGRDTNAQSFFEYKAVAVDEYYFTFAKDCFPITISPAILGKSGFSHEFGDWYINVDAQGVDNGLPFIRYKLKEKSWYLEKRKLWTQPVYLHQLQNLYYSLLNKELNIHLGYFENVALLGPIDFFVKPLRKKTLIGELL